MRSNYEQLGATAYYTMHGDTYRSPHDLAVRLVCHPSRRCISHSPEGERPERERLDETGWGWW